MAPAGLGVLTWTLKADKELFQWGTVESARKRGIDLTRPLPGGKYRKKQNVSLGGFSPKQLNNLPLPSLEQERTSPAGTGGD